MERMENRSVLVVEDEEIAREYVCEALRDKRFDVHEAATGTDAAEALAAREYAVVVSDIRMPGMDGMRLLEHIKRVCPDTEVILATGFASVEDAVQAMKMGAYQYIAKPLRLDEVVLMVERAVEKRRLQVEVGELRRRLSGESTVRILGDSPVIRRLRQDIRRVAPADCTVLVLGDTGTGKELVARALHADSGRSERRFLAVNCAALTEDLLARELFGHEKSAFTGAYSAQKGLLEAADKGTFFLDEVGDMSLGMQASMLRVLEDRTFFRVGGTRDIPVDVRIVAATNKNLRQMVEEGTFRRDLFYRLNIMTLQVPPLAGRREDITLLAHFFLRQADSAKKVRDIDAAAMKLLCGYNYPGNVRELRHIMERAAVLCSGDMVTPAHLPPEVSERPAASTGRESERVFVSLEENERNYLAEVMQAAGGSAGKAAALLGINRGTLWRKLKRFGLSD